MKAREVIADCFSNATDPVCEDICPADFADEAIRMLTESGFVILPKEPSDEDLDAALREANRMICEDGMIAKTASAFPTDLLADKVFPYRCFYRAMISHAEGEKG